MNVVECLANRDCKTDLQPGGNLHFVLSWNLVMLCYILVFGNKQKDVNAIRIEKRSSKMDFFSVYLVCW